MAAKFEISKDKAGKFRWHLKAANREIIAASQAYDTRASAQKGIESVKTNAAAAKVVDLTEQVPAHNYGTARINRGAFERSVSIRRLAVQAD
jgi:uncharacterized protein YegP (UPF0339 family)